MLRGRAVGQAAFPKPPAGFLRQHTASPAQVRPPPEGGKGAERRGRGSPGSSAGVGWGVEAGRQAGRKEKTSEQGERREPKRSLAVSSFPFAAARRQEVSQLPRGARLGAPGPALLGRLPGMGQGCPGVSW